MEPTRGGLIIQSERYFARYDDITLIFGKDIVNSLRYIRLCYDYIGTGDHSVSWLKPPPIENKIKLEYTPKTGISYYIYNEILNKYNTVATLLQAHPPGWAFECLGPNVPLELEPTRGGLIIQSERYNRAKR